MNNKEICDLAILHAKVDISAINARRWINDAMRNKLQQYDTARIRTTTTIACTDTDLYYTFPTDLIGLLKVTDSDGKKYYYYEISGTTIKFDDEDTYTLEYQRKPVQVTASDSYTPEINSMYHECIAKHIAAMELTQRDPQRSAILKAEFLDEAKEVHISLNRIKRKDIRIKMRKWL